MSEALLTINTDGAARGNPGPAAFAFVIARDGQPPIEEAGCLGRMTNNQAEYTALVRALEHAARLGTAHRVLIQSDSELLVKQMNGEYRVKDDTLRGLYEQAVRLSGQFPSVIFRHVRRAQNSEADRLCNEALDGKRAGGPKPVALPRPATTPADADSPRRRRASQEMTECLRAAAGAWARGNAQEPKPEQVCEQLWSILEESGVLRRPKPR